MNLFYYDYFGDYHDKIEYISVVEKHRYFSRQSN